MVPEQYSLDLGSVDTTVTVEPFVGGNWYVGQDTYKSGGFSTQMYYDPEKEKFRQEADELRKQVKENRVTIDALLDTIKLLASKV